MASIYFTGVCGGTILAGRVSKKTDYRPRRQGAIRVKRVDMLWICEGFGPVITVGS
jgi:hypothetical protein